MSGLIDTTERTRFLRAIRKCLSDAHSYLLDAMDELDEIGKGTLGTGMTPLVGGYAMKDPKDNYRTALIKLDAAEKSMEPLAKRFKDGRIDKSYFKNEKAFTLLRDIVDFEYQILVEMLAERRGRESVWYRLKEISDMTEEVFNLVAEN
ncbi:MAG: hypothetical protein EAX95_09590 [Candidatus Thorarchaeota archaeon]|nr:hypothetical protein [Candidatus Thorarchaeota archaeon]